MISRTKLLSPLGKTPPHHSATATGICTILPIIIIQNQSHVFILDILDSQVADFDFAC